MRLDKFLKVSRIIKRRPIAKVVVDGGKAKLNGKVAKASTEVKVGQILELEYFNKYFKSKREFPGSPALRTLCLSLLWA